MIPGCIHFGWGEGVRDWVANKWLSVRCSLIGVVVGLLVARSYFGFITLLGIVALSGVVINNAIAIRSMMNLCLTFDHRILDGMQAGAFLAGVKSRLEAMGPEMDVWRMEPGLAG